MSETPPDQPRVWRDIRKMLRADEAQARQNEKSEPRHPSCTCDECSNPIAFNAMICLSCGRFYVVQAAWNLFLVTLILWLLLAIPIVVLQLMFHWR